MGSMDDKVKEIIRNHVIFSMTAGAIPVPLADIAAVTAIQLDMIKQIAGKHKVNYDDNKGKSFATALTGATLARLGASLVKSIPGIGTLLGIGTQVILSGASTYALGNLFDRHFTEGGTLLDFDTEKMKIKYNELVDKGKDFAKKIKKELKKEDTFKTLDKLKKLKESGSISEKEYEDTKKKLLKKVGEGDNN
jgi:uncharacterized protein (DUF697 family)